MDACQSGRIIYTADGGFKRGEDGVPNARRLDTPIKKKKGKRLTKGQEVQQAPFLAARHSRCFFGHLKKFGIMGRRYRRIDFDAHDTDCNGGQPHQL